MALPTSFWAQVAGAGLQGVLGIGQMIAGATMNPKRPTYEIPDEIKNMLALRQMNLGGRMAGATQAQTNIQQSQGNTIGAYQGTMRNPNAILAGVSAAQGQTNRSMNNLASMESQDYQRRLSGLEGAQRTMAGFRDKAFQVNEYEPYQDKARTKAALIGAGLRNIGGVGSAVAGAAGEAQYMQMLQGMYGNQQPQQQQSMGVVDPLPMRGIDPVQSMEQPNFSTSAATPNYSSSIMPMVQNMQFNQWVQKTTGRKSTDFTNTELAYLRSQYSG